MEVKVYKGHISLEQCVAGTLKEVASTELVRFVMAPGVRRIMVREGRVRGALFLPPGPGPFPAVIDVFGGFGGLREYRAGKLTCIYNLILHKEYTLYIYLHSSVYVIILEVLI